MTCNASLIETIERSVPAAPTRTGNERLVTMLSTAADKHGSLARNTEVPRRVLVQALGTASDLHNTQSLRTKAQFWIDAEFPL